MVESSDFFFFFQNTEGVVCQIKREKEIQTRTQYFNQQNKHINVTDDFFKTDQLVGNNMKCAKPVNANTKEAIDQYCMDEVNNDNRIAGTLTVTSSQSALVDLSSDVHNDLSNPNLWVTWEELGVPYWEDP